MMRLVIAAAMVALSGAAVAEDSVMRDHDAGISFVVTCDEDGYLLTAQTPNGLPAIYLRNDCTADGGALGKGEWGWSHTATGIALENGGFGFQYGHPYCVREPYIPLPDACLF